MNPHPIPSDAEIARIRLGRVWWIGEHSLKSQDAAIVVFSSGRIRNGNDRNGAADHELKSVVGFIRPNIRPHGLPRQRRSECRHDASAASSAGRWFGGSLLLDPLPYLLDGQPVAELAVVVPLVPLDLPLEGLGFSHDLLKISGDPILRSLLIHLTFKRVAAARGACHLAILVVTRPHELCRG